MKNKIQQALGIEYVVKESPCILSSLEIFKKRRGWFENLFPMKLLATIHYATEDMFATTKDTWIADRLTYFGFKVIRG